MPVYVANDCYFVMARHGYATRPPASQPGCSRQRWQWQLHHRLPRQRTSRASLLSCLYQAVGGYSAQPPQRCAGCCSIKLQMPSRRVRPSAGVRLTRQAGTVAHAETLAELTGQPQWDDGSDSCAETVAELPPAEGMWRTTIGVVSGALLLCNLHRSTFSVLLPVLLAEFSLSASQAGLIQSAMLVAYLLGQLPSGRLADRMGGKR